MTALVWLRSDLRTYDNSALAAARDSGALRVLYIATPGQWQEHGMSLRQQNLIYQVLTDLESSLAQRGIPFDVEVLDHFRDIPAWLARYCEHHHISAVHANREYLVNEWQRDSEVERALSLPCHWYHDRLLIEPGAVLTGNGEPYKVFTPFARRWHAILAERHPTPGRRPKALGPARATRAIPRFCEEVDVSAWPGSEEQALRRLRRFCAERVQDYHQQRDLPAVDGTSQLSPALAIGLLSPRQCLARLQAESGGAVPQGKNGEATWLNELVWREFYQHVAFQFPRVVKGRAFKPETEQIRWRNNPADFQAWCEGHTGYPIVDAGMRQLKQTGWMHNRLRMITASFLVKDLHIDWRWGERYFLSQLIDGEFAANNGGWQWAASTGTDAAPYFRIFNPTTQGQRFDPKGRFIRRFVPELAGLDNKAMHRPPATADYPAPIVDHAEARIQALALFKAVQG